MAENKVKMVKALNAITLESTNDTTQADAARTIVEAYESDKLNLCCSYTTGAGETSNVCDITLFGFDGSNWIQVGETGYSTGVATHTPSTFRISGASAATEYKAHFVIPTVCFTKFKVAALETGVSTNKGTLSVSVLVA